MSSAWAPFRHRMFAAMAAAAFVSNVGSWMQTVGAQWLMLTLTGSATYVALVQSAASVPIFLFAVLAGTIGDLVDRRRFLIVAQTYMFVVATAPVSYTHLDVYKRQGQVTVEGNSFRLPSPFHVIATSNPIEYEGTYALPEAQLDRFMVRLAVGYPERAGEAQILLNRVERRHEVASVEPVVDAATLSAMQAGIERVYVEPDIANYCVDLAAATRRHLSLIHI